MKCAMVEGQLMFKFDDGTTTVCDCPHKEEIALEFAHMEATIKKLRAELELVNK